MKVSISRGTASVLGPDLRFEGKITSAGDVFVLGTLQGTVNARKLTIDKNGTMEGDVEAEAVVIHGSFSGNLTAGSVSLHRGASVNADITYVSMEVEPGAVHCGHSRHVDHFDAKPVRDAAPVLELIHSSPEPA
jgi:cytoskeletal protein CcmA (bactofilin family)